MAIQQDILISSPKKQVWSGVSMTRVEVILPSWEPMIPETLTSAFVRKNSTTKEIEPLEWFDAGGSNCFAILACEISRPLTDQEAQALKEAILSQEILLYECFTR